MMLWLIATILLGFIFLSLLIFADAIESKKDEKDEKIFELSKKNIILQHEVERLLKKRVKGIENKLNETIEDMNTHDLSEHGKGYKAALTDLLEWINEEDE